jgi:hypothetical protein
VVGPFARPFEVFEKIAKEKDAPLYKCPDRTLLNYDFNEENKEISKLNFILFFNLQSFLD